MSYGSNPYAPVAGAGQLPGANLRLAGLDKRFLGFLVDSLIGAILITPGYALMLAGGAASSDGRGIGAMGLIGVMWVLVAGLAVIAAQIYLLATRSQSIGKYVMKTQIVDVNTGRPANFVSTFLLRLLVNSLICGIPCIGFIYFIVDSCYIFREDRRCIHDLIAQTRVVDIS